MSTHTRPVPRSGQRAFESSSVGRSRPRVVKPSTGLRDRPRRGSAFAGRLPKVPGDVAGISVPNRSIATATGHIVGAGSSIRHGRGSHRAARGGHAFSGRGSSYPTLGFNNAFHEFRHLNNSGRRHDSGHGRHSGHGLHFEHGPHYSSYYDLYGYHGYPGFRSRYFDYYPSTYYGTHTTVYLNEPTVEPYENQIVLEDSALYEDSTVTSPTSPRGGSSQSQLAEGPDVRPEAPISPWIDSGSAAFAAGRYDEARGLFLRAIFVDEEDGFAKLLYGLASFADGDYRLAAVALRRALEVTPELVDNPIDLRGFYPDAETLQGHIQALVDSLEKNPLDADGAFLLGYLYYATGEPQKAYETLQRAAEVDPTNEFATRVGERAKRYADDTTSAP